MGGVRNLNIPITGDSVPFISAMADVKDAARSGMGESAKYVAEFQAGLLQASSDMKAAAEQMFGGITAANDAFAQSAADSADAVRKVTEAANESRFDQWSERIATGAAAGFGAAYVETENALHKIENYAEAKLTIMGIALVTGVAAATLTAGYAIYKSADFIFGLFSGESYKSASIDALNETNDKVKELQGTLAISSVTAGALQDALNRLGVPKDDYVAAWNGATSAMRTNGDELDRLGVKYKDANGKMLDNETFLKNVKAKLDEYTAGWDRNQAAVAIGAGSYDQVASALKVSQDEIRKSKERLDDYNLGIGHDAQEAIDRYNQAMRDFNNEMKLTGDGFKRAWADQIMPVLTDLADFLKEGWPYAVNVFRYSMATVTSLFYGLKEVAGIIITSILEPFEAVNDVLGRVGSAVMHLVQGDYKSAVDELKAMPDDLSKHWDAYQQKIIDQSEKNTKAMKLAWGFDDRRDSSPVPGGGKQFQKPDGGAHSAFEAYMTELDMLAEKANHSQYALMQLKAAQLAEKEGIHDTTSALKIHNIQRADSEKAVKDYEEKLRTENQAYQDQYELIGKNALQTELLTNAKKHERETQAMIDAAEKSGKPLDKQAETEAWRANAAAVKADQDAIMRNYDAHRSWETGATNAFNAYIDNATNAAQQSQKLFGDMFKGMEDGLASFAKTGKLNFSSLADSIVTDLIRIQTQKAIAGILGGPGGWASNFFGPAHALGAVYVNGVQAFAQGGVVNSPTLFPHASGMGLMGEAGPEAIMPLKRGADGSLGVVASGAQQGGTVIQINVQVDAQGQASVTGGTSGLADLGKRIGDVSRQVLLDEMRPGGLLAQAGVHAA